jgi:hypothetical protein
MDEHGDGSEHSLNSAVLSVGVAYFWGRPFASLGLEFFDFEARLYRTGGQ